MEDDLLWKTAFGGRQPLVEDDLQWKTPSVDPCMQPNPLWSILIMMPRLTTILDYVTQPSQTITDNYIRLS